MPWRDHTVALLAAQAALIDDHGVVVECNSAWCDGVRLRRPAGWLVPVGSSVFAACERLRGQIELADELPSEYFGFRPPHAAEAASSEWRLIDGIRSAVHSLEPWRTECCEYRGGVITAYRVTASCCPPDVRAASGVIASSAAHLQTIVLIEDLTELRRAEEDRACHSRRLQAILQTAADAIVTIDDSETILSFNPAAERMFGYRAREVVGSCLWRLLQETAPKGTPSKDVSSGAEGQRLSSGLEIQGIRSNGLTFPAQLAVSDWHDRRHRARIVILRDLSEQRRAQLEVNEALFGLQALLQATSEVAVIATNPEGIITTFNRGAERMLGYDASQFLDRGSIAALFVPEELENRAAELAAAGVHAPAGFEAIAAVARDHGTERRSWSLMRSDGMRLTTDLTLTCVRSAEQDVVGFLAVAVDTTEWSQAQRELAAAKQYAETAAAHAAAEAHRARHDFLSNMNHAVRTPLTSIVGYARMLADRQKNPADQAELCRTIVQNAEHLLEIMDDILELSQLESGRADVPRAPADPFRVLYDVLETFRERAAAKNLALQVKARRPIPATIQTNARRLGQILAQLIGNAVKFTSSGSVTIELDVGGEPDRRQLLFDVVDTGPGISGDELSRLFTPFAHLQIVRPGPGAGGAAEPPSGTGLGLVIARRLAHLLGGTVEVASQPGKGSRFTLSVATGPLEGVALRETAPAWPVEPTRTSADDLPLKGRVLIVDDRVDIQKLLTHAVHKLGLDAEVAGNGREAVAAAQASEFDVILMDMQMPLMDGYEATRTLRGAGYRGTIIAVTAHTMAGDRERCLAAGCDEHVPKPIDSRRLAEVLRRRIRPRTVSRQGVAVQLGPEELLAAIRRIPPPVWVILRDTHVPHAPLELQIDSDHSADSWRRLRASILASWPNGGELFVLDLATRMTVYSLEWGPGGSPVMLRTPDSHGEAAPEDWSQLLNTPQQRVKIGDMRKWLSTV